MPPTGLPLLILVGVTATSVAAVTVRTWRRHHLRWQVLTRPAAVLLTEALALLTVGLAVNRAEDLYPTWADLLPAHAAHHDTGPARPGHLDHWITAQARRASTTPVAFPWHPPHGNRWPVTAAPTVIVPADYPLHPTWRYPVVTVLADHATPTQEAAAARTAEDRTAATIVVFAHLRTTAAVDTLTDTLPDSLARDLRVTTHSWALIAPADLAGLARAVVRAAPTRYPALALLEDTPKPTVDVVPADLPTTETVTVVGAPRRHTGSAADQLPTALLWACQQTPPPLNVPAPLIPPPPPRHTHTRPSRTAPPTGH